MTKEQKAKWIAALKSGKYKQARNQLHDPITGGNCCLGVAIRVCEAKRMVHREFVVEGFLPEEIQRALADLNDNDDPETCEDSSVPFEIIAGFIAECVEPTA